MKLLTLAAALFGTAQALTCSTTGTRGSPPKKCPSNMRCKITYKGRPEVDIPNRGVCVKTSTGTKTGTKKTPSVNYNKAYAAFNAADVDHSGTINFGGAYKALASLFPNANEKTLDHMTKTADKAHYDGQTHRYVFRDGKIDKSEFVTLYLNLLRQQQRGGSSNPCKNHGCSYGQTCYACKSSAGYCCKRIVTVGPHEKPNGGLSKTELAQVTNLFQAINTHKSSSSGALSREYLTYSELFAFLRKVSTTFGTRSNLYRQVEQNIVFHGDQDHNSRVTFKEFVTSCAKLKKSDAKDFPKFLSVAASQNTLPVGSSCMPTGSTKCAKGSSCMPVSQRKQRPMPHVYDMIQQHPDGHLMIPEDTNRRGTQARPTSYKHSYKSYKCQVRPQSCEACVQQKGKWFGSHCILSGEPMVYDAPMTSSVKGCKKKTAMQHARCSQYKSCARCTTRTKNKALGQLCAWRSNGSGNCVQNTGSFWGPPMITSSNACKSDVVHVHG